MMLRTLVAFLVLAVASAFEAPSMMSRRSILSAVAAAAPLAAVAPALADGDNRYLTMVSRPEVKNPAKVEANYKGKSVGIPNLTVDDNGSAVPKKGIALGDTKSVANYANSGSTLSPAVKDKAMARLMAQ